MRACLTFIAAVTLTLTRWPWPGYPKDLYTKNDVCRSRLSKVRARTDARDRKHYHKL